MRQSGARPSGGDGMRRIAVVTDDAAALPPEWLSDDPTGATSPSGLTVVGMPVVVDDQIFAPVANSREPDLSRSLLVALAEGRRVSTSRPSPGQFRRAYQDLADEGYEGIVSVHLSAELSGTVSSARIARQGIPIPVTVVDTRTVAMAQGYAVMAAWAAAGEGGDMAAVAAAAHQAGAHHVFLYVPSLDQLKRGGRLAPSVARLGSMLQIKPLLTVQDGRLTVAEMPRTAVKAVARFRALVGGSLEQAMAAPVFAAETHEGGSGQPDLVVHHLADPDSAHDLAEHLIERYAPQATARVVEIPPVLAAHVGIGVRAAVVRHRAAVPPQPR
ncbi:DegV family protein [Kocuria sp.]|uniref:DegV family protein n=1 Tax=Kocuria sp. TaxID=1871328 RepID=UPI0026DEB482|nr:DegV family protein [Kocuria sp.]MDO5617678.1 DegV family protein [Kocuria sp.]